MGVLGITFPQGPELIVIIAVLVLLFGAKKLPELGSSVGRTITNFKKGVAEAQQEEQEDDGSAGEAPDSEAVDSGVGESGVSDERDTSGS